MNNVSKSIQWCNFTLNPVKGLCPINCKDKFGKPYCYARKAYGRNCSDVFKDKSIRYDHSVLSQIRQSKVGDKIFVGSTIDLFHKETIGYLAPILHTCTKWKDRTFIFLTKCPENLPKVSPKNCWIGVSCTDDVMFTKAWKYLKDIKATVKLVSIEPLQHWNMSLEDTIWTLKTAGISWVICGRQTPKSKKTAPKIEELKIIAQASQNANCALFLKDNLHELLEYNCACGDEHILDWARNENGTHSLKHEFPQLKGSN